MSGCLKTDVTLLPNLVGQNKITSKMLTKETSNSEILKNPKVMSSCSKKI